MSGNLKSMTEVLNSLRSFDCIASRPEQECKTMRNSIKLCDLLISRAERKYKLTKVNDKK